jgi:hypothetical protein
MSRTTTLGDLNIPVPGELWCTASKMCIGQAGPLNSQEYIAISSRHKEYVKNSEKLETIFKLSLILST